MAAGGFREFVAGEVLDEDKINDFLMQGVLVFADAAARDAAVTAPVEGQFSFRTDDDVLEFYDGSDWVALTSTLDVEFLIIAGGGAGGSIGDGCGGGGAGGHVAGTATIAPGTYPLTIGAGAAPIDLTGAFTIGSSGNGSKCIGKDAVGGGGGGTFSMARGQAGGSGSGGTGSLNNFGSAYPGGESLSGQGNDGGTGNFSGTASQRNGGGGGGAGAVGGNGANTVGGNGGNGLASSITGSSVTRAGGGGGGARGVTPGSAGTGGGGAGTSGGTAGSGDANTGGGGGGAGNNGTPGNGGSGVVIFAVPVGTSVSFSGGVTESDAVVSGNDVYTVTAAGPTDTVTIG